MLMGTAGAGLLACVMLFYVMPRMQQKNLLQVKTYNTQIATALMKGPAVTGPPVLLKPNVDLDPILKTNSLGMRSPELSREKTVPRVLVLGDSYTFGYGLSEGEPFCSVIARKWKGKLEIANAAVSGFEIQDSAAQFERVVDRVKPDLVVMTFVSNDLDDSRIFEPTPTGGYVREPRIDELTDDIFASTTNYLRLAHGSNLQGDAFMSFATKYAAGGNALPFGIGPFARARWIRYKTEFSRIVTSARQRGAGVLLYLFATRELPSLGHLTTICDELGVPVFVQDDAFDMRKPENRLAWDPHPSALANAVFADRLERAFATVGILKDPSIEPLAPLKATPEMHAAWTRQQLSVGARYGLNQSVVFLPRDQQANLQQVIGGFEDAQGLIGARGIVLLHSERPVSMLRIMASCDPKVASEGPRTLVIRLNGESKGREIQVGAAATNIDLALSDEQVEKVVLDKTTFLVEVDVRDPLVASTEPALRKSKLGVRVHRLEIF